ncbi:La [Candida viswanathii]|uniref:La n=1 Tax=Candida viswanathii TaxID=5486 RepID=A0A367YDF2_9ASCO|nr:La [Candida viswanathii]
MTDFVYQGEDFEEKVKKQVEFYFSDSNLQSDKFLWKIYEANDGWVELKTILTFGRMRQYRPEEKVIEALQKSDKLVLSSNNEMIRRKDPVKDFNEVKNTKKRNTLHIEGFPKDLSQEDVENWVNEKIVGELPKEKEVCSVRRIKSRAKKEFFGVVDVEFKTQEDCEYILNNVELSYPKGIVTKEEAEGLEKKDFLKKMTLLTFQEMRESGKRFGVNEVTKRRNSFNDKGGNKKSKKGNHNKHNKHNNNKKQDSDKKETEEKLEKVEEKESTEASKEVSEAPKETAEPPKETAEAPKETTEAAEAPKEAEPAKESAEPAKEE